MAAAFQRLINFCTANYFQLFCLNLLIKIFITIYSVLEIRKKEEKMKILKREKFIETEYKEIHIQRLNEENIPYVVKERTRIISWARVAYFTYSVILDCVVVGTIIYYFFVA